MTSGLGGSSWKLCEIIPDEVTVADASLSEILQTCSKWKMSTSLVRSHIPLQDFEQLQGARFRHDTERKVLTVPFVTTNHVDTVNPTSKCVCFTT